MNKYFYVEIKDKFPLNATSVALSTARTMNDFDRVKHARSNKLSTLYISPEVLLRG